MCRHESNWPDSVIDKAKLPPVTGSTRSDLIMTTDYRYGLTKTVHRNYACLIVTIVTVIPGHLSFFKTRPQHPLRPLPDYPKGARVAWLRPIRGWN